MEEPIQTPNNENKRVFKTPLIVPFSVIVVIIIYLGYIYFHIDNQEKGIFLSFKNSAFEVFLLAEFGLMSIILYNQKQLSAFLNEYPVIQFDSTLDILKPIIRTNMYSSLLSFFLLAVVSLAAIMTILNHGSLKAAIVVALSVITAKLIAWYNPVEEKMKQIECQSDALDAELNDILQCWMHKAFPNF